MPGGSSAGVGGGETRGARTPPRKVQEAPAVGVTAATGLSAGRLLAGAAVPREQSIEGVAEGLTLLRT